MGLRIVAGDTGGRALKPVKGVRTRPTSSLVRGAVFSLLGTATQGVRALDLFAGTGSLGIEALSRGALWVDFVEVDRRQCATLRQSLESLGHTERAHVYCARAERAITFLQGPYDLVLFDPPYDYPTIDTLLQYMAQASLVRGGGLLVVEHSSRRPLQESYGSLRLFKQRRYGDTCISLYKAGEK